MAKLIYTMDFLLVLDLPHSPLGHKFMSPEHTDLLTSVMLVALADPSSPLPCPPPGWEMQT